MNISNIIVLSIVMILFVLAIKFVLSEKMPCGCNCSKCHRCKNSEKKILCH